MTPQAFFEQLWANYIEITPQAEQVRQLFLKTDADVINDHVAFRTFAGTPIDLDALEPLVLAMGYEFQADYDFTEKKLRAKSYIHPDLTVPKIFISELKTDLLSDKAQAILAKYTSEITEAPSSQAIFWSGRHWSAPTWQDYNELMAETEYGAWLLAIGVKVNHFTVSVEQLTSTQDIREVLRRVQEAGFAINTSGGEVKGTPSDLLEQGSTMADKMPIEFANGELHTIPTCFYEFAKRHPNSQGELYQGFIAANADKIFESTNAM